MNGKGDKPRNCFSKDYKSNYEEINWGSTSESKFNDTKETNVQDKRNIQNVQPTQQGCKET
jgi:hypothetical protein